ncbi:CCE_0567 family metalloprotein [Tepidiphilus baoligensis]|nr:CCE_0567 family metalloprotein [Tepidiphilus baoligensis]
MNGGKAMETQEALKAEVKRLNARAMAARMALHDLSEELPVGLDRVMAVAQETVTAFEQLEAARRRLAQAGS